MEKFLTALKEFAIKHERTAAFCFIVYLGYDLLKLYMTLTIGG